VQSGQSAFHRSIALGLVLGLMSVSTGCLWSKRGDTQSVGSIEPIALTPSLWLSPSVTTSMVSYTDACGKSSTLPMGDMLAEALPKKLGLAFTGLTPQLGLEQVEGTNGFIEVGLGFKQVDLVVPPQAPGTYPATVTLGTELVVLSMDGSLVFSAKVQGKGRGEVEVVEQSCLVTGLEPVVQQAIEDVGERLLKQVAGSSEIRAYARHQSVSPTVAPSSSAAISASAPIGGGTPIAGNVASAGPSAFTGESPTSTILTFHAIVRDESQDHMVQQGEAITIEVEVRNSGQIEAKDVEVLVGGDGTLSGHFPPTVKIGNLQPGESKRTSITNRVADLEHVERAELHLSVGSGTPLAPSPSPKHFTLSVKPEKWMTDAAASDIDIPPKPFATPKQTKAVIIAIGIGTFRDHHMSPVMYAGRDAEIMAAYLGALGGVPDERIRVLRDHRALKEDLAETFDNWLPKQVDASTVVYVYFAGRALVNGKDGAVSLVPFDDTTTGTKRLYPVRHIQEVLARLPIHRAIMMFEVSLDPFPGANPAKTPHADWGIGADEETEQVMWMVGNRRLQEANAYEPGKHGLFTYQLLRGLKGLADIDRDGTVTAGELCTYARREVIQVAREQFGNAQHPLCSPPAGQGAVVRIHPMAKGDNPKPPAPEKKTEPAVKNSGGSQPPMNVGPEK